MAGRPGIQFGRFALSASEDVLYQGTEALPLEPQAVRVLRYLAEQRERVVPKQELLTNLWPGVATTEAVLKKAVWQARRALGDEASDGRFIRTFHRRGYRFVAALTEVGPGPVTAADPDFGQLVGREGELRALQAEYRRTLAGEGCPVIVSGEAGSRMPQSRSP